MITCDRCGATTTGFTCSMFNTQNICNTCERKERAHPQYEAARAAENEAVAGGDLNFPGIGLPDDLVEPRPDEPA